MPAPPPPPPTTMTTQSLAQLVRQKRKLLEHLATLGRQQAGLIEAGDLAALVGLLASKQQVVDALRAIEGGLDRFRDEDPDTRRWAGPAERDACRADADACNRLLAEVLRAEAEHERQLAEQRDAVGSRLRQTQTAHAAASAYKPHLAATRRPAPLGIDAATAASSIDLTTGG